MTHRLLLLLLLVFVWRDDRRAPSPMNHRVYTITNTAVTVNVHGLEQFATEPHRYGNSHAIRQR